MSTPDHFPQGTAASENLAQCQSCHSLTRIADSAHCHFCGARLALRIPQSVQRTLAFLFTALLFYIPANLFPIMSTESLGHSEAHTIAEGVLTFWRQGAYPIALVIFCASLLIPVAKMLALVWWSGCAGLSISAASSIGSSSPGFTT